MAGLVLRSQTALQSQARILLLVHHLSDSNAFCDKYGHSKSDCVEDKNQQAKNANQALYQ